jgi:starch-binding outer membrane protein, SusD/RagB family
MKKTIIKMFAALAFLVAVNGCKKESLDLVNPNEPTEASLETEAGITRYAAGVYERFGLNYWWMALANHDVMGDSYYIPWGNFGWRWVNQVTRITNTGTGATFTPPQGGEQKVELKSRNNRSFGDDNAFLHEWQSNYFVNSQANGILKALGNPALSLGTDADTKRKTLKAWAYWWKGFTYSRIGSMYIAGLILDEAGTTNNEFKTWQAVLAEATKNFDLAIAELNTLPAAGNATYNAMMAILIPDFTRTGSGGLFDPAGWIRQINTYKARNIMVNKKPAEITAAEWTTIETLCNNGINASDKIFTMRSAQENDLVSQTAWSVPRLLNGWFFLSERLVQDFPANPLGGTAAGDDGRYTRNVIARASPVVSQSGRGFQYGTRWTLKEISAGGDWASTTTGLGEIPVGCSYEENQLMLAERKIRGGDVPGGIVHINNVRTKQNAGALMQITGVLTQAEALEQLRRERRIGLFLKNVAFYDARRWGVIDPVSAGGGRAGAKVLFASGIADCVIDYNYMPRWDVPLNELDFNAPSLTSAPTAVN